MLPEMLQLSIVVAYMTPRQLVRSQHSPVVVMRGYGATGRGNGTVTGVFSTIYVVAELESWSCKCERPDVHGVLVSDVVILTAAHHHASGILLIGDPSVSLSAE